MNKEKVLNKLIDIQNELIGETTADELNYEAYQLSKDFLIPINGAIDDVIDDMTKPVVMPEVFDDWYKEREDSLLINYYILQEFDDLAMQRERLFDGNDQIAPDVDVELSKWMWGKRTLDKGKYQMCIEAIINGYEVED